MSKAFFVDTTRCTACRGCQVACKEWKGLKPGMTKQTGTHQNPPDLNAVTPKLVRFSEHMIDGKVEWFFFPDQCRHCVAPPCLDVADIYVEGAVIQDEKTNAVLYTDKIRQLTKEQFEEMREACPYNIPRRDDETGEVMKCDMCHDRVVNGLLPMCVKTCPTGTMNFGEAEDMMELATKRLAEVKKKWPKASLIDYRDVNVIYLVVEEQEKYGVFVADRSPVGLNPKLGLA
ncbi:4Fe-4S dicluster domain-containing protein [Pseudodesulfovibrio tunisiensis]|uniref:4Fe-4S dicluster domain-containing protein n=1 Tax=Pseudodesulfovibrio tunisiensis TaxID=463192 RepID=UPI001FB530C8|nr:4Fe-4S dicluster domain-containing protein [Pseudodesulfovibrio tunisiensis]